MTPITEQGLLDMGFKSFRRSKVTYNSHIYDFQMSGDDFQVIRYNPLREDVIRFNLRQDDKFIVRFYDETVYPGFEYIEQIELLIKALHP